MIYGLISSYREGSLLSSAVRSAQAGCDVVCVWEGPVGPDAILDPTRGGIWLGYFGEDVAINFGAWGSDEGKRTVMLQWAQHHHTRMRDSDGAFDIGEDDPLWIIWLDGDEVLIWPEYLRDWCDRASKETGIGGFPLRIVELDGSVAKSYGRIFNGYAVDHFVGSSYQVMTPSGMVIALPNQPICSAGGIPLNPPVDPLQLTQAQYKSEVQTWLADARPPLQGEPHILHRSLLRDPARGVRRLNEDEQLFYSGKHT